MKTIVASIVFLVLTPPLLADAQAPTRNPPLTDLTIVKFNWSKERIGWERDPFSVAGEDDESRRARLRLEKRAQDAKRSGNSSDANRQEDDVRIAVALRARNSQQAKPPRYVFRYKLQVKNSGQKTLTAIYWDYVFYDVRTKEEVGRRQFLSEVKMRPGKGESLEFTIPNPPAQTISVYALDKKDTDSLRGDVQIVRIEFEDGTVWERPPESLPKPPRTDQGSVRQHDGA